MSVMADNSVGESYFQALELIQKPPAGAAAILPCRVEEKRYFLDLFNKRSKNSFANLKVSDNGNVYNTENEQIEIYKGDFSNEGKTEYAVVTTSGSMHVNTVTVYRLISGQLIDMHLDNIIIEKLLPGKDMSHFYFHVATPFAVTKNGKTYLRFMSYPGGHRDYDKTKLELCTYFWQGKNFNLVGPNWGFVHSKNQLIHNKNCIR